MMKSRIQLNQVEVSNWNYEKIAQDFDIYQIVLDKYIDRNILDTNDSSVLVLATVYYHGQQCFVMTRKGQTDEMALQYILNKEVEGKDAHCTVRQIRIKALSKRPGEMRKMFGYRNRALVQLLINSTLNAVFPEDDYNNITGRCYYYNQAWNDNSGKKIELIDLTIERDMVIYPSVSTFTKEKPNTGHTVRIVFDKLNNVVRKALKTDKEDNIYYKQGIEGTHASRAFDGTTLQYWEKSRMSSVAKFYRLVRRELQQYVTIGFSQVEARCISTKDLFLGTEEIKNVLRDNGINLVDNIRFSPKEEMASEEKINTLVSWIKDSSNAYRQELSVFCCQNGIPFSEGAKDLYRLNIEMIRTEKFYDINKELQDVYVPEKGLVCQHTTVPVNYKTKSGEVIKSFIEKLNTIFKELVVKTDIRDRKISLIDWTAFNQRRPLSFYMAMSCASDTDKKKKSVQIKGMTISPDGTFTTEQIIIDDIKHPYIEDLRQYKIAKSFYRRNFDSEYFDRNIELLIFDEIEDAYIVRRTNVRAMSNIEEMERSFMDEKKDAALGTEIILSAIESLQYDSNPSYVDVYYDLCNAMKGKGTVLKSEILPLLTPKLKEGQKKPTICRKAKEAIANATGVVLKVGRSADDESRLGTEVYKHIHLWPAQEFDADESCDDPAQIYCYTVGQFDGLNQSVATSPVVRQIIRCNGKAPDIETVEKLVSMMQVGFVRMKNYTVLPFPAKYLREI